MRRAVDFLHIFLGGFTHRQFGLKHAEFPGAAVKIKKNVTDSYILFTLQNGK